ncbi:hypothetical protein [Roseibium sp. TrichSKD4]|uniref:hypothetical protein n=1 Tax=Roseibium sp. TrichSKD4 TaxID=744980 RepID=UPI0002F09539|nr:hypothetical protein [Roseibium sp. TrichSKD4]
MFKTFRFHTLIFCSLLLVVGTVTDKVLAKSDEAPPKFELLHLWATPEEGHALRAFSNPTKEKGVDWSEHAVETNFLGVRRAYAERLALFAPPSAVFWIGGNEAVSALVDQGTFRKIPLEVGGHDFSEILRTEILDVVRYDESHFALLPVGIHLQNHILYNDGLLELFAQEPPKTWEQFLSLAEMVHAKGYYGISVSDQRWQIRFLIGSIMAEFFSADQFQTLISGDSQSPQIKENLGLSFKVLKRLRYVANPDFKDLYWDTAVDHVVQGRALANVLGDFSSPLLPPSGGVTCEMPPGNTYVLWSLDTIALTNAVGVRHTAGQNIFIETVAIPEHIQTYIIRKGGVPAYKNVDSSLLHPCSKQSTEHWDKASDKFLLSSREWTQTMDAIAAVGQIIWRDPSHSINDAVEEALHSLKALSLAREKLGAE